MRFAWLALVAACGGEDPGQRIDAGPCVDDTHDEDGDGVGDACDVCPTAPDPRQLDTTELATMFAFPDGVGDACDPRPRLAGDVLAALHTFVAATGWMGDGWGVDGDAAIATGTARWIHRTPERGDGIYVQARLAAPPVWMAGGTLELIVDGDGIETGFVCGIDDAHQLYAYEVGSAPIMKAADMPITGAVTLTAWRVIDFQRRGEFRCKVAFEGELIELELATTDDIAVGLYGIAQRAATTAVTSLAVYTSPTLPEQDL